MEPSDFYDELRRDLVRRVRAQLRRLGSQEAEDLVQETFLRGLKNVGELPGCAHEPRCTRPADCSTVFRRWAYGTLKNVVKEAWREYERQRMLRARAADAESLVSDTEIPGMSDKEIRQGVERILVSEGGRGRRQYEAFCLWELDGLDQAEVAQRMGISPSTVYNLCAQARAKLRGALGPNRDLGDWPGNDR